MSNKICSVPECGKKYLAKDLCTNHYALMKRNGSPEKQIRKWQIGCAIADCEEKYAGNGYCMRHYEMQRKYNLAPEDYEKILQKQNNVCAICNNPAVNGNSKSLAVDHDHATGNVRGLLCSNCNRGIGLLGDNIEILKSAITYLESFR
jgi:hypothetical protein